MPLVNALQHNSPDVFNHASEMPNRFTKIKSLWSFQVKNKRESDSPDIDLPELSQFDASDSGPPSSFIT